MSVTIIALSPSAPGNFTVAHGIAGGPSFLPPIVMTSLGVIVYQSPIAYDATNLYLEASAGGITGVAEIGTAGGGELSGTALRYDGNVRDVIGDSLNGVSVAVLTQPSSAATFPGSPLATIYSGPNSTTPTVTGASWLAGYATVAINTIPADVVVGSYVEFDSISPAGYNGIAQITGINVLNITFALNVNPGTYVSGGTCRTSALPNPFLSDNIGNFFFYAPAELYTVQLYGGTLRQPLVLPDQAIISGGSGVSSIGLVMPAEFTVSGSPVTGSGDITVTKANENANLVYAGPATGSAAVPTFRAIVAADVTGLAGAGTVTSVSSNNCTPIFTTAVTAPTSTPAIGFTLSNAAQNTALMGPTGGAGLPTYRKVTPADTTTPPLPTVGACFLGPTGAVSAVSWRAPFACTVTNVRAYLVGGTNAVINAQHNGVDLVGDLTDSSAGSWQDAGTITGTAAMSVGDTITLEIVSVSGSPTSVTIQVEMSRP